MAKNNSSEPAKPNKYEYQVFCLFLGVVLGFTFSWVIYVLNQKIQFNPASWNWLISDENGKLILIIMAGAFGGLLQSLRYPSLPERKSKKSKLSNSLIGIGGALVVFLIVPGKITDINTIELLATALIGGYGGGSLLDQALDSILKKQEELETQVFQNLGDITSTKQQLKETEEELKTAKKQLAENTKQIQRDADTLKLLSRYLDKSLKLSDEGKRELINNIGSISATTRILVFDKTKAVFYGIRDKKDKDKDTVDKKLVGNALIIFQKLKETDTAQNNDRYPAHEAYAHMELEQWQEAIEQLEEAKRRLIEVSNKGENGQNQIVYDVNIAICKLKIYPENEEEIIIGLREIKNVHKLIPSKYDYLINNLIEHQYEKEDNVSPEAIARR